MIFNFRHFQSVCHRYSASSLIAVLLAFARIIGRRATYRYALPKSYAVPENTRYTKDTLYKRFPGIRIPGYNSKETI